MSVESVRVAAGPASRTEHETAHRPLLLLFGGFAVLAIAWVHYYLYFKGGYRDIAPDNFGGLTISRSFAIDAIAGFVIGWALVVAVRMPKLAVLSAVAGVAFAAATLGAYLWSRYVGLLGFEDRSFGWEEIVAIISEIVALASLGTWLAFQGLSVISRR